MLSTREIVVEMHRCRKGRPIGPHRYRITCRDGVPIVLKCMYRRGQGNDEVERLVWTEGKHRSEHVNRVLKAATAPGEQQPLP